MKTLHLLLIMFTVIVFLGFGLKPVQADDTNGVSIQNIQVQPSTVKVGDTFTVTATLVNNSTVPIMLDGDTCSIKEMQVPFFTVMFDDHAKSKSKNINCAGAGVSQILNSGKNIIGTSPSPDSELNYIATESGTSNVTVTFSYYVKNQDPTQPNIEQTISKSLLFTIYDNSTGTKSANAIVLSPLKQFKSGIAIKDIQCKQGLTLVMKAKDKSPACIKISSIKRLISQGWILPDTIKVTNSDFSFNYSITGGSVEKSILDAQSKSLIISIKATNNGTLTVTIPRAMLDAKMSNNQDDSFVILVDGIEIAYTETKTIADRTLTIPFNQDATQIELIATEIT